jgi:hypothetical protein
MPIILCIDADKVAIPNLAGVNCIRPVECEVNPIKVVNLRNRTEESKN